MSVPKLAALALPVLAAACTVGGRRHPPGIEGAGIVSGHAVVGWRDEHGILDLDLLDGSTGSPGTLAELVVWRLLRVEVGLAGVALGLGPFDVGLGAIAYAPALPRFVERFVDDDSAEDDAEAPAEALPEAWSAPALEVLRDSL